MKKEIQLQLDVWKDMHEVYEKISKGPFWAQLLCDSGAPKPSKISLCIYV